MTSRLPAVILLSAHGAYPVLDRSRAGRCSGDAGLQRCLGEPGQYRRDQQCADATSWRECGAPGLQRRCTRRLHGGRHRVLARAVAFAMSQPEDVDVNEILFRPTRQDL
jgi:hypothetical protein